MSALVIRPAEPRDAAEIIALIRDLAEYELSPAEAIATEAQLAAALFGGTSQLPGVAANTPNGYPAAYCHVVESDHGDARRLAGFALWFLNYSTWLGCHGVYLEDLFVRPEYRGRGYGRELLATLASIAESRSYARVEWWVLDWNEPALEFYRKLGAIPMSEWTVQRLTTGPLRKLAAQAKSSEET